MSSLGFLYKDFDTIFGDIDPKTNSMLDCV